MPASEQPARPEEAKPAPTKILPKGAGLEEPDYPVSPAGCWNCGSRIHHYSRCPQPRQRVFCYACVSIKDCPRCGREWGPGGGTPRPQVEDRTEATRSTPGRARESRWFFAFHGARVESVFFSLSPLSSLFVYVRARTELYFFFFFSLISFFLYFALRNPCTRG